MKITCLILAYNEAGRIATALSHASQWADEVVVADKGSADATEEITLAYGARFERIPFSRQGHESLADIAALASHDWTWTFSPGEVPTRSVIECGKAAISDEIDCVVVPLKYWSFGVHDRRSPWGISHQPRLMNRKRIEWTGVAHSPIKPCRCVAIPYSETRFILHQTHATAAGFMAAHCDYMINEAASGTPAEAYERAIKNHSEWDAAFLQSPALMPQMIGWKIYWLGVALHALERGGANVPDEYRKRALTMNRIHWQAPPL